MKECPKCKREWEDKVLFCPLDGQPLVEKVFQDPFIGVLLDNKYRLREKIGEGGYGTVYRATHIEIDSTVAVKILHPHLASDKLTIERFRREARAAAQIRHPNAVVVTDFGVTKNEGTAYLVMEFLEGVDLRSKLKQQKQMDFQEAILIIAQACEAVHAAHLKGIIHRDLKPDNIWLTKSDDVVPQVKVLDCLIASTKMLEQVISAKREQHPAPDITAAIVRLEKLVQNSTPVESFQQQTNLPPEQASLAAPASQITEANQEATKLWRFEFIPTPELAERGININFVRARLQEAGELKNGAPRVLPGGSIAFEFMLATSLDESAFAELHQCGLTYELVQEPEPVIPEVAEPDNAPAKNENAAPIVASANIVRVNLNRLDDLMRMVGDLVISRSRLQDQLKQAEPEMPARHWRALQETSQTVERQIRDLREGVMRVRMVPVGEIFERMRFIIRDLSREYQKQIKLELSGQETEIDKLLIERLIDPLMHLVRNAISHGLESPDERTASGKPSAGTITLRAFTVAETVVIEVEDDGRGIDRRKVVERAYRMGLQAENINLSDEALLDLICSPGFSTREEADRTSGRGVGMAVVQNMVLGLGGAFTVDTEVGRGTRFIIQLPITVAIAEALIVTAGGQKFAVPQSAVREVLTVEPVSIKAFQSNEIIPYRSGVLPLIRLARLFGLAENSGQMLQAFVIGSGANAFGIAVDRILGQREIVVRSLGDPLIQIAGFAGATELGDGRAVLILDATALGKQAANRHRIN